MKKISHSGEVRKIEGQMVLVAIVASGACHTCRARQVCGMSESTEKLIEVYTPEAAQYRVGERVRVSEEQSMAFRAVWIAYGGALVVLLGVLVGALACGISEGMAALLSLLGVALYYGAIYLFREKIEQKIYFTITKN